MNVTEINQRDHVDRPRWTRRRLLRIGGFATMASLFGWAKWFEPHWLEVTEHPLTIANLPVGLLGKTLVHVSDLHIGSTDEDYLISVMKVVNEVSADILVFTGDIIDHNFPNSMETVSRILAEVNPGSIATLGCLGNHDYGYHFSDNEVADNVAQVMRDHRIEVLRDDHAIINGLHIFGLEDFWSPNFEAIHVLRLATKSEPSLCLCHNPDVCDLPVWRNFQGPILAGHTHGGQCKPPLLPPPRLPVHNRRYVSGFYDVGPGRKLYISRGVGYGLKARFNCRPEVTLFRLG